MEAMSVLTEINLTPNGIPCPGFAEMQAEARNEGIRFIDRLDSEWTSGDNRFDGAGEVLYGVVDDGVLVALGGLNRDPFVEDPTVGRIRRVYVRPGWRHRGLGTALVCALIERARQHFGSVRLRAETPYAVSIYEGLGFLPIHDPEATHILPLGAVSRVHPGPSPFR